MGKKINLKDVLADYVSSSIEAKKLVDIPDFRVSIWKVDSFAAFRPSHYAHQEAFLHVPVKGQGIKPIYTSELWHTMNLLESRSLSKRDIANWAWKVLKAHGKAK